jgi:lipopolysaccharide transport system ATP-binding protein
MSSDDIVITVRNLTKHYRMFDHPGSRIKQFLSLGLKRYHREFTALDNVSFDIRKGETVGIIGRNGSGKSTLLQLICGILKPTSGSISVNGRVSALLELGAGFNPEFTGRENVYFQGALMGYTKKQMDERFNDIAAFADIEEFIDQPVRTYSSGMYVRLAFSVANSMSPDVLVVDEALAVGDYAFQRKCFAQLDLLRSAGCTIIFVSHDTSVILSQCDKALLLKKGKLILFGEPKHVAETYLSSDAGGAFATMPDMPASGTYDPGLVPISTMVYPKCGAEILTPRILDSHGKPANILRCGVEYDYVFDVRFEQPCKQVRFGMLIKAIDGRELGGLVSASKGNGLRFDAGEQHQQRFRFRCSLLPGTYFLNAGVVGPDEQYLHRIIDAAMFTVLAEPGSLCTGMIDISGSSH